ncbi:MAG TPA: single-stranded DNA-binding protein [Thermoleophilaceae bacterium]
MSLLGQVVGEPQLRETRAAIPECRMRLAIPRRSRDGKREPGVVYVDVSTFGDEARECARRLQEGSTLGLVGRIEDDPYGVLIDQLTFL